MATEMKRCLPLPAWWPKNPYRGDTGRNYNDNFRREGYEIALIDTWQTFCDWLDVSQIHHFQLLQDELDTLRYPDDAK